MINIDYISDKLRRTVKVKKQRDGRYHVQSNSLGLNMNIETIEELEKYQMHIRNMCWFLDLN